MRRLPLLFLVSLLCGLGLLMASVLTARGDPVIRHLRLEATDWPRGAPSMKVALVSDIHIGNFATDEARLRRIVDQVNALRPDLVLIAGDFIAGHDPADAEQLAPGLAPLGGLKPPLGTVAVPGNHDHWTGIDAVERTLRSLGITLIRNAAVRRGALTIVGVDDLHTQHDDLRRALTATAPDVPALLLSHSPDLAPALARGVLLAGHTHCGQIWLPFVGVPVVPSRYGQRYRCGIIREGGRLVLVTAGVGTSIMPFRLGVPPDLWLVTLGPARRA